MAREGYESRITKINVHAKLGLAPDWLTRKPDDPSNIEITFSPFFPARVIFEPDGKDEARRLTWRGSPRPISSSRSMGAFAATPALVPGAGVGLPLDPRNPRASTLYQLLDSSAATVSGKGQVMMLYVLLVADGNHRGRKLEAEAPQ